MKIKIVAVGKIKENFYREAVAEYLKRLSRFCKMEIAEVDEELCTNSSEKNILATKQAEGERIVKHIKGYVVALDMRGKELASEELAEKIKTLATSGVSEISFVIGGSFGLSDEVREKADMLLSFGRATFPHQLMRVVLCEQIYRGFMINEGSPYHK